MTWSVDALIAIAHRLARLVGAHIDEVLPVIRIRDRKLVGIYVRGRGVIRW